MTINITELSNGFRIATEHMAGLGSATLGVWVAAGARHEREDQNGIAHFLEHMAFKGTATRSALKIAEDIEDAGGYLNAYTSREATAYYARVLAADVGRALEVLGDILRNSALEEREIEIERGVILQEIGQTLDTPDDIIFDWLQETAFPAQALGRSILGPAERVSGFGRPEIAGFIGQHYHPERMILAAAGAVDHDALVRQAEALFGDMPRGGAVQTERPHFARGAERREVKTLEQAHWCMAFQGPSFRDPDFHAGQIHAIAMGGGMSSRLFQEIRERQGLAYSIFASAGAWEDGGMVTLYAGTSERDLERLTLTAMDELARAGRDMTTAELERARAQLKAGMVMGLESSSARAERLARSLALWGRVPPLEESVAKIEAVDLAHLKRFSAELAQAAPAVQALYGPVAGAPGLADLDHRRAA